MKNDQELLSSMVKTTRMAETGLRAVLRCQIQPELGTVLQNQLHMNDSLEEEAKKLAKNRGWQLHKSNTAFQNMIERMTVLKLMGGNRTSRIADMVIQGNTQGMIKSTRDLNHDHGKDQQLRQLNRKLIDGEKKCIGQMTPFL